MDAFIPLLTGAGSVSIVQTKQSTTYQATFDAPPTQGNKIFAYVNGQQGIANLPMDVGGLTTIGTMMEAESVSGAGVARLAYRDVQAGDPAGPYGTGTVASNLQTTLIEVAGLPAGGPLNVVGADDQTDTSVDIAITPSGGVAAWLLGAFSSYLYPPFGGTPTFTPNGSTTAIGTLAYNPSMWGVGQPFYGTSGGGSVTLGGTQGGTTNGSYRYGIRVAAFSTTGGSLSWPAAPDTVDGADGTSDDVDDSAVAATSGVFWRGDLGSAQSIGEIRAVLGMEDAGDVTVLLQAGDASDWSDAATVESFVLDATGSFTADEVGLVFDATDSYRYWQLVIDPDDQGVRVYEVGLTEASVFVPPSPGKAVLEIYVHDEDASRWGEATWATGPATGTEGIWSAAGWQDVTPQGIWAHIIWGSRRPDRGILAEQDPASWTVETYDPDRILDPGNPDSPYAPQLLAGVPIRISHEDGLVVRTGQIDDWQYNYKPPAYKGRILASDTIALLYRAYTPADSILGDTLMERIQDAVNAAGIMVGGIPLPPGGPSGPALSEWVEGAATDDDNRVWDIMRKAGEEVLYVIYVNADASIGMRPWGSPLDRGREIGAPNLEDLASRTSEDGVFSVVKVQVADPDLDPIIRAAAPLPRYGRRVYERTETTIDPEGWAAAVLADRAWQGVQYVPGAIHCFTAEDVQNFGSLEIMERVQLTHPGVVTVSGRILGGELWVEGRTDRDAKWIFQFHVATEGSTAVGLTTLVSDQLGEPLVDDMTETDYLEEN